MFEVHRERSVDWKPTAVVALATSVDQSQVAVAREDASIEIWNAAPGSVGWHCELAIPGRDDSVISSLVWCQSISRSCSSGRLFSAGLDGSISEWDLGSLQQKTVVEAIGGSIWQMAAEPLQCARDSRVESIRHNDDGEDDDENGINSTASGSDSEEEELVVQRVAVGCDDGAVRIYVVREEGMEYYRSFPRVEGKILSVVWSLDAKKIFAGGSDRPYTINMIERLMHEVHFAVDPHKSSKQQALDLIREFQKHFPIKRSPMRLRLVIPEIQEANFLQKIQTWNPCIVSKEVSGNQLSMVCQIEPGYFRDCDAIVRDCKGRLEILSAPVHKEEDVEEDVRVLGDNNQEALTENIHNLELGRSESESQVKRLAKSMNNATVGDNSSSNAKLGTGKGPGVEGTAINQEEKRQQKCTTCNASVGDAKQYRDHFKSDWHKHNLKRKMKQLPPLSPEECLVDREVIDVQKDLGDYSF